MLEARFISIFYDSLVLTWVGFENEVFDFACGGLIYELPDKSQAVVGGVECGSRFFGESGFV